MLFLKKQPRLTPEINPLPSLSSTLTDQPDPEVIDNSSCSTESQDNVTDRGVKVQVNNSVCIARFKTSCYYAKVTSIRKTKVNISYLKKTTNGLIYLDVTWKQTIYRFSPHQLNFLFIRKSARIKRSRSSCNQEQTKAQLFLNFDFSGCNIYTYIFVQRFIKIHVDTMLYVTCAEL